ncbi:hypothetical protein M3Y96_00438600 [Aphelenchoides besseyi]|nr:hypothetical protein M3Y96_00438600 [Aphelenchoides besseyi]
MKSAKKEKKTSMSVETPNTNGGQKERPFLKVRFGQSPVYEAPEHPRNYPFKKTTDENVHTLFRRLKIQCDYEKISGAEPIILEFLNAIALYVHHLVEPKDQNFRDYLLDCLEPQLSHLTNNGERRFPLPLGNVIRQLKKAIRNGDATGKTTKEVVEANVRRWLEEFYKNSILEATNAIVMFTLEKIERLNATKILTYSWSPIVERILLDHANEAPTHFNVTIIDGMPNGPGTKLLKSLAQRGVHCTYGGLNSIANELPQSNIVLLGATAVLSNGNVIAHRGAANVAYLAKAFNIPLLVTVKSYQFMDKVRTIEKHPVVALDSELLENVDAELITALVTDIRILPPTSAPAVFKAKQ